MSLWVWVGDSMGGKQRSYICCAVAPNFERAKKVARMTFADQVVNSPLLTEDMEPDWDKGWHRYDDEARAVMQTHSVPTDHFCFADELGTWDWNPVLSAWVWGENGVRPTYFIDAGGHEYKIPTHWKAFRFSKRGALKEVAIEGEIA